MKLVLDKNSEKPIYLQIVDQVVQMIQSGELVSGEKLPTERELKKEYHVSAGTVKTAYKTLCQMKKVFSVQGSGTYVTRTQTELEMRHLRMEIDAVLYKAFTAGLEAQAVRAMVDQEISRFRLRSNPKVRVAWVGACEEFLRMAETELSAMPLVHLESFNFCLVRKNPTVLEDNFDLIITTERFYGKVCDLVPQQRDKVYQTSLTMSRESVYQLSTLDAEEEVLFWCLHDTFEQVVRARLLAHHNPEKCHSATGTNPTVDQLAQYPVLVVPAKAFLFAHEDMLACIQEAAQRGTHVVYINYELDRGSVLLVRSLVDNTWSEKCSSGLCNIDNNLEYHRPGYEGDVNAEP